MKKFKPYIILLLIVSIILFISFFDYIVQEWPFIPYFDTRTQYRQYFAEFTRLINSSIRFRSFPFWSWNFFFGNNFWASKSYQILGDMFAYLTLLIKGHVYNKILFITLLKYIIAATGFYIYLKYRNISNKSRIIGALLFAFSSYMLRFTEQPFFITFYVLIPFYLISIEQVLNKKRPYTFIFMVGFMTITNYYLFYTTTIFSLIYFMYRSYELKYGIKQTFRLLIDFIFYYLIGISMAAFIIIPTYFSIINNPRVGNVTSNLFFYSDIKTYFNIIMSIFLPMQSSLSGIFYSSQYNLESYIWAGSITTLIIPQAFCSQDRSTRKANIILYVLLVLLLLLPLGGSIMHGFSEPNLRWEFIILIFNIIVVLPYLENINLINIKVLIISLVVIILSIVFGYLLFNLITNYSIKFDLNQVLIYSLYILIYIALFFVLLKSKDNEKTKIFIILILILELTFTTHLTFNKSSAKSFSWDTINKVEKVLGDEGELSKYLQTFDTSEEFYRVYVPYDSVYWVFSLNMNLIYDFMDTKTYDTTYQTSNNDLFKIIENENYYDWFIDVKNPHVIDFVGVKYALVRDKTELPHMNFSFIGTYNYLEVYLNNNYNGVFKSYNNVLSYEEYSLINNPELINTHIIAHEGDQEEIRLLLNHSDYKYNIKNAEKYQNMLIAFADNSEDIFIVSNIAFDEGWSVSINNISQKTYSTNGGFLSFNIPSGGGEIKLYFMPRGFKIGAIVSFIALASFMLLIIVKEFKNKLSRVKK